MSNNNHIISLLIEGNITNINITTKHKIKKIITDVFSGNNKKLKLSGIKFLNKRNINKTTSKILELSILNNDDSSIDISRFWGMLSKIKRTVNEKTDIQTKLPSLSSTNLIEEELYNKNAEVIQKLMKSSSIKRKSSIRRKTSIKRKPSNKKTKLSVKNNKLLRK